MFICNCNNGNNLQRVFMRMELSDYWNDFVDMLFPRNCAACENALLGSEQLLCTDCRISLPRMESDSAIKASLPGKFIGYQEVQGVIAYLAFTKKGKVQNLLHALKYGGQKEVGVLLGKMMARELVEEGIFPSADLIVSVPLHDRKQKERGYNQSDVFAEGLSLVTGIPWSGTMLVRTRYTVSQTGKTKSERRNNVKGIFELVGITSPAGKAVILVDDILTTGATLEACLEVLIDAGCTKVYILTIAAAQ